MAVSKVQRIEGVPQFSDTAAYLAAVPEPDEKAEDAA